VGARLERARGDVTERDLAAAADVEEAGTTLDGEGAALLIVRAARGPDGEDAEPRGRRADGGLDVPGDLVQHRALHVACGEHASGDDLDDPVPGGRARGQVVFD